MQTSAVREDPAMDLQITTLAERPELEPQLWSMPHS